jgi:hypothetical protein
MQESQNSNALHWILGAALLLISLFVVISLVNVKSQADNVSSDVTITNADPVLSGIIITDADDLSNDSDIIPSAGANNIIYIKGIITDNNGEEQIAAGTGKMAVAFYEAGTTCAVEGLAAEDDNYCYKSATSNHTTVSANADAAGPCVITEAYGDATQAAFSCPITLGFNANSTVTGGGASGANWIASVKVIDAVAGTDTNAASTVEIGLQSALDIEASISYGTLGLGAATAVPADAGDTLVLTQEGNDQMTVKVSSADAMTCTLGTIPVANQEYSLVSFTHGSGSDLSGTPTATGVLVDYYTTSLTTDDLFFGIQIPSTGVAGTCTGTIVVAAEASA